jgi:hypothetical protein
MAGRSDLEEVTVELVHATDKAWLVTDGRVVGGKRVDVWIPKSQCELERDPGKASYTLTAPEWKLKDVGLL